MIVVLAAECSASDAAEVLARTEALGLEARLLSATGRHLIHVTAGPTRRARRLLGMERVVGLIPTSGPRVRREGRRFYPYHAIGWAALFVSMVAVLCALAANAPPGLGARVDPHVPPDELAAPVHVRPLVGWLRLFPAGLEWLAWLLLGLLAAAVLLLPLYDRGSGSGARRAGVRLAGVALAVGVVLLALKGGA